MSINYYLISDAAREGYELGRGPWGEKRFLEAVDFDDPAILIAFLLKEEPAFTERYATTIAVAIMFFAANHKDWRVVNDWQWDGDVVDDEWRAVLLDEGRDPLCDEFPIYHKVGSRYLPQPLVPGTVAWENLTERQREVILKYRKESQSNG